nr:DUF952 domain-containing protein [Polymorphobacter fuscus]
MRADEWSTLQATGEFAGSADDLRDGYIHMSPPEQVAGTAAKWFAGEVGVMAVTFNADVLAADLRWEPARGGSLFPHLYRPLRLAEVMHAEPV